MTAAPEGPPPPGLPPTVEPEPPEQTWEDRNNAYLAASLHWLRRRLVALADAEGRVEARPPVAPPAPPLESAPPLPDPAPAVAVPALPSTTPDPNLPASPAAPVSRRGFWGRFRVRASTHPGPPAAVAPLSPPADDAPPPLPLPPVAPIVVVVDEPPPAPLDEDDDIEPPEDLPTMPGDQPPALIALAHRLGLSDFERDILLLAAASDLDPGIAELCGQAQRHPGRAYPSLGLALRLFDGPEWEALGPHRPLRRLQLVTLGRASESVVHAQLRADERVVNLLKGLDHIDERLTELFVPMAAGAGDLPVAASHRDTIDTVVRWARAAGSTTVAVCLTGPHSASKRILAQMVAAELGVYAMRLPVNNLPPLGAELTQVIRLWERDSLLSPLALYLDASDQAGEPSQEARHAADRLLTRAPGLVFVDSREMWAGLDSTALVVDVANPTPDEQRAAWGSAIADGEAGLADDLAAHFDLDPVSIHQLAAANGAPGADADPEDRRRALWRGVLVSTRPGLDLLGRREEPKATAGDLVLPPDVVEQIVRIEEQVRYRSTVYNDWGLAERMSRGLGISALFAGESGTGKTLAAEVIAADLGLDLYRIDLSGVVSKYIGETEKNLRRVFDAAEHGGVILCFDEADALFGKRSEVKDSHDRYANIEVNYLLQRMEDYRGLAILTTNMKSALDHAFTRRIRFVVNFPFPGPVERELIWRRAFVAALRTDRLDFERLARLTLAGGSIHNVAVNATFAAAARPDHALTMPMVLAAARLEYRKNGLPLNEAAFKWEEPAPPTLALKASAAGEEP